MVLVIMAAGMGSRYGGLKQIEPIGPNGEYIIDYSIYDAYKAGIRKVVFVIKEENYDIFVETIGRRVEEHMEVSYVFQDINDIPENVVLEEKRIKPWGTTQAILACKKVVKEPFIVINADDFYGRNAFLQMTNFLQENKKGYAMTSYILENTITENGTVSRGVCQVDENNYLIDIMECKKIQKNEEKIQYLLDDKWYDLSPKSIVSMNFWGFRPDLFDNLEEEFKKFFEESKDNLNTAECLIPISIGNLQKQNKCTVKVLQTDDKWYGITYKEDKEEIVSAIHKLIEQGVYPKYLWK